MPSHRFTQHALDDYSLQLWFVSPNTSTDCVAAASSDPPVWPCQWHFLYWLWNIMATFNLHLQFANDLLKYLNICGRQRQVIKLYLLIKGTETCILPETSIDFVGDIYSTILFVLWGLLKCLQVMEYISILFKICLAISRTTSSPD